ncbi:MAG: sigma-70 family RNA polymerase sigma factor [bacterium]|nr:sigma-70 family RNA polymerase sigma factor [bacterium]
MTVENKETKKQERRLIEASQNGDTKAFGLLIRMHQKRLFRFIYGLLGSFDMTEDVVQDAFVRAFKAIDRVNPDYGFYPWLSTIARNLAYNQIRKEEKKESLDSLQEVGFDPQSVALGPMESLLNDENKKRFFEALQSMPVKYRSVFVLRHFEDMDYAAIGSYLKIPPGTVDSRLYRARKYLLEQLKELL